jgi:hypothetical protein
LQVSSLLNHHGIRNNSRADDSKNKCSPGQAAIDSAIDLGADRGTLRTRHRTPMSPWARQNSHNDESHNKEDIENDQEYAEQVGMSASDAELQGRCDERVEDCSSENAFHSAVGASGAADETDYLGDANGEED